MGETIEGKDMIKEINKAFIALQEAVENKATQEEIEKIQDAIDNIEAKMQRANFSKPDNDYTPEETKTIEAYSKYVRGQMDLEAKDFYDKLNAEYKAMGGDVAADGGVFIPQILERRIIDKIRLISPIRMVASSQRIGIGNQLEIPRKAKHGSSGWVGERAARPETDTPEYELVKIPLGEMYANAAVTSRLLEDQDFGVENLILQDIAEGFAQTEGIAFVSGNGVDKPTGLLDDSSELPEVEAAVDYDGLIKLIYDLPTAYARNADFLAKRSTIRDLRLLKDNDGNPIWQPSMQLGQPSSLLGYSIYETPDLPDNAVGAYPILFGDFKEGYLIVDKRGMTLLRDPYTNKPFINYYSTMRVGGKVTQPDALRKLKATAPSGGVEG